MNFRPHWNARSIYTVIRSNPNAISVHYNVALPTDCRKFKSLNATVRLGIPAKFCSTQQHASSSTHPRVLSMRAHWVHTQVCAHHISLSAVRHARITHIHLLTGRLIKKGAKCYKICALHQLDVSVSRVAFSAGAVGPHCLWKDNVRGFLSLCWNWYSDKLVDSGFVFVGFIRLYISWDQHGLSFDCQGTC